MCDIDRITKDSVGRHLKAVDIDLRCALAFSRALLQGLAALSPDARSALQAALNDEIALIANDDSEVATAALAIVGEARDQLQQDAPAQARLADQMERALINKAASLADDGWSQADDSAVRARRCG